MQLDSIAQWLVVWPIKSSSKEYLMVSCPHTLIQIMQFNQLEENLITFSHLQNFQLGMNNWKKLCVAISLCGNKRNFKHLNLVFEKNLEKYR